MRAFTSNLETMIPKVEFTDPENQGFGYLQHLDFSNVKNQLLQETSCTDFNFMALKLEAGLENLQTFADRRRSSGKPLKESECASIVRGILQDLKYLHDDVFNGVVLRQVPSHQVTVAESVFLGDRSLASGPGDSSLEGALCTNCAGRPCCHCFRVQEMGKI